MEYLKRMAAYHRGEADAADAAYEQLVSKHPSVALSVFSSDNPSSRHLKRARDFDHALFRPWLAFVDCKPDTIFGVPTQKLPQPPLLKRLKPREDGSDQLEY